MNKRQLLLWSSTFAGASTLVKGGYALLVIYLAKTLTPDAYGVFGLLYATQNAVSALAGVGVQETTIGKLHANPQPGSQDVLYREAIGVFCLSAIPSFLAIAALVFYVTRDQVVSLFGICCALILGLINAAAALQASLMRLSERHAASLMFMAGVPLLSCMGSAIALLWQGTVDAVFAGGVVGGVIGLTTLFIRGVGYVSAPARWRSVPLMRPLFPFVIIALFGWLGGYGINFVIQSLSDAVQVARYTFFFTVASITQMIATAMNMVWAPRFYRLYTELPLCEVERQNRRFFTLQAWALGVLAGMATAALPWLTYAMGGHLTSYGSMKFEFALLLAGYVLTIPWWHTHNYFLVSNRGPDVMRFILWTGTAGQVIWIASIFCLGEIGIYLGFLTQTALKSIGLWVYSRRDWELSPPWAAIAGGLLLVFAGLTIPGPA